MYCIYLAMSQMIFHKIELRGGKILTTERVCLIVEYFREEKFPYDATTIENEHEMCSPEADLYPAMSP